MTNDIRLSRSQISKIFQSGVFLGLSLSKRAGALMKEAFPLAKYFLSSIRNNSSCLSN